MTRSWLLIVLVVGAVLAGCLGGGTKQPSGSSFGPGTVLTYEGGHRIYIQSTDPWTGVVDNTWQGGANGFKITANGTVLRTGPVNASAVEEARYTDTPHISPFFFGASVVPEDLKHVATTEAHAAGIINVSEPFTFRGTYRAVNVTAEGSVQTVSLREPHVLLVSYQPGGGGFELANVTEGSYDPSTVSPPTPAGATDAGSRRDGDGAGTDRTPDGDTATGEGPDSAGFEPGTVLEYRDYAFRFLGTDPWTGVAVEQTTDDTVVQWVRATAPRQIAATGTFLASEYRSTMAYSSNSSNYISFAWGLWNATAMERVRNGQDVAVTRRGVTTRFTVSDRFTFHGLSVRNVTLVSDMTTGTFTVAMQPPYPVVAGYRNGRVQERLVAVKETAQLPPVADRPAPRPASTAGGEGPIGPDGDIYGGARVTLRFTGVSRSQVNRSLFRLHRSSIQGYGEYVIDGSGPYTATVELASTPALARDMFQELAGDRVSVVGVEAFGPHPDFDAVNMVVGGLTYDLPTDSPDPAKGRAAAPVTVHVWTALSQDCTACETFLTFRLPELVDRYATDALGNGTATFVLHDLPTREDTVFARASQCGWRLAPDRYWNNLGTMVDVVSPEPTPASAAAYMAAWQGSPTASDIESCMAAERTRSEVQDDIAAAAGYGITQPPGVRVTGPDGEQVLTANLTVPRIGDAIAAVR
ncbi:MAG: thioredoxin domain-containing protein [Candidatus Nanohaloarchaea archaeon]|nr:thioredoxin domain-containing protein [Candidatus Nanohaloarchaea archaeon]